MTVLRHENVRPWLDEWREWLRKRGLRLDDVGYVNTETGEAQVWERNERGDRFRRIGDDEPVHEIVKIDLDGMPPFREWPITT